MLKHTILVAAVAGMALAMAAGSASANVILFADTFDRPDSTDLNASTAGKSGTLGALDYGINHRGCLAAIDNNMLKLRELGGGGGGWIVAYLDHNFVDADVANAGGFSISIDLIDYATAGSGRWKAICVGQSLAEINSLSTNWPSSQDLFVGYRWTQKQLEVYKNGVLASETDIPTYGVPQTMKIDYAFSDFNAGSTVGYDVYLGADLITSGTFTWSGADENYISIFSNLASDLSHFDNLEISAAALPTVWDSDTGAADAQDGDGVWIDGGDNWWDGEGSANVAWDNARWNVAVFGAGNATADPIITVDMVSASGLEFNDANGHKYTLRAVTGAQITLAGSAPTIEANVDARIEAPIAGTRGLTKTGPATLEITGVNTYTGGVAVTEGTLVGHTLSILGDVALSNGSNVTFDQGFDASFSGAITGEGSVTKTGARRPARRRWN